MAKPTIVTRAGKGSALTWTEGDTNLTNLRDATITITDGTNSKAIDLNGTITFTAGSNITLSVNSSTGAVTINGSSGGIASVNADTSPSLGGDLNVNGKSIISASNGNIAIVPNGSGNILLTPATGHVTISAVNFPTNDGTANQVLKTNGSGQLSWTTISSGSGTVTSVSGSGTVNGLSLSGTVTSSGSLTLGGTLDLSSPPAIGGTTAAAISATTLTFKSPQETIYNIGNSANGTWAPNPLNGSIQTITATGNFTLSAFTNPVAGQSITIIITQDATGGRTLTSTMKFAGGIKTLSTAANAVDILSVFYDGTNYFASLGKGFA